MFVHKREIYAVWHGHAVGYVSSSNERLNFRKVLTNCVPQVDFSPIVYISLFIRMVEYVRNMWMEKCVQALQRSIKYQKQRKVNFFSYFFHVSCKTKHDNFLCGSN